MMPQSKILFKFVALLLCAICAGCNEVDDERIPNMVVNVSFANIGVWNTYGVSGFGSHKNFIHNPKEGNQPSGFPYNAKSATGFGGVLLIEGMDPNNNLTAYPLAYDLACPVERTPNIRVYIDNDTYVAVCPACGSVYDVTMAAGYPLRGEAAEGKYKYSLKRYQVIPNGSGGYYITN